jgi:hypothetical protein
VDENRVIRKRRAPDFVDKVGSPVASMPLSETDGIASRDVTPADAASNADDPPAATSSLRRIVDRDLDWKVLMEQCVAVASVPQWNRILDRAIVVRMETPSGPGAINLTRQRTGAVGFERSQRRLKLADYRRE